MEIERCMKEIEHIQDIDKLEVMKEEKGRKQDYKKNLREITLIQVKDQ